MHQFIEFVINHWMLWLALVAVLVAIISYETFTQSMGVSQISPQQMTHLINQSGAIVVDVRTKDDFAKGHITGALLCPADTVAERMEILEPYKTKPLVLTCQTGSQSAEVANQLKKSAFQQVFALRGGLNSWKEASLPLVKS